MKTKDWFILFLVVLSAGTIANLIALAIAGKVMQDQVDSTVSSNPILRLFASKPAAS